MTENRHADDVAGVIASAFLVSVVFGSWLVDALTSVRPWVWTLFGLWSLGLGISVYRWWMTRRSIPTSIWMPWLMLVIVGALLEYVLSTLT